MISHLVRIEGGRSTGSLINQGLVGQCVQDVLGAGESASPFLLGCEFRLQPPCNPILLVRRKGRYPGEDTFESPSHASSILPGGLPNKPLQRTKACQLSVEVQ